MPKNQSSQLRLYVEQEPTWYPSADRDVIDRVCAVFQDVTGYELTWQDQFQTPATDAGAGRRSTTFPLPDGKRANAPALQLTDSRSAARLEPRQAEDTEHDASFGVCRQFAEALSELIGNLHATRLALRDREGELAAAVPLVCDPADDRLRVAERLEAVLRAGADMINCSAAALYLLDDFTQHLKLRSHWGLADDCFAQAPRPLRGAIADLEALMGHAVVLDRPSRFKTWNAPEDFGSAVCVPISTATVPLGTLWFFDAEVRDYDDREVGLVELVSGRLAAELEREILLRSQINSQAPDEALVRDWLKLTWPPMPCRRGWQIGTLPGIEGSLPHSCLLHRMDSDRLQLVMSMARDRDLRGALVNAGAVSVAQIDGVEREPAELAEHLDLAAAQVSFEEAPLASWCARLNMSEGRLDYCQTGQLEAFIVRPHAWELLGGSQPKLASLDERTYMQYQTMLEPGDALLVIAGLRHAVSDEASEESEDQRPIDGPHLAELILRHNHQTAEETVRLLESLLNHHRHIWQHLPGLLLIRRD